MSGKGECKETAICFRPVVINYTHSCLGAVSKMKRACFISNRDKLGLLGLWDGRGVAG